MLSKDADQNLIVARHQLPFSFNVVSKNCQAQARPPPTSGAKRSRLQMEQSDEGPSTCDQRNARLRFEGPSQRALGNERIDNVMPAINLRDPPLPGQHRDAGPSSSPSVTPPAQLSPNAGPNHDSLNTPHRAMTDQQPTPTLTDVNPDSGSIVGGARIWLQGTNFRAHFPLFARFGTAVVSTVSIMETPFEPYLIRLLRLSLPVPFFHVICLPRLCQVASMLRS